MANLQFSVSWDSYQNSICNGLSSLQQRGEFVDMTLAADGHLVRVHRMVLSLVSPYIKQLIASADCSHPVIFLNNISYSTLCSMLEYIYTGEVLVHKDSLGELMQAGKALHIKGLVDMVENCSMTQTDHLDSMTDSVSSSRKDNLKTICNNKSQELKSNKTDPEVSEDIEEEIYDHNDITQSDDNFDDTYEDHEVECEKIYARNRSDVEKLYVNKEKISSLKKESATVHYTLSNQGSLQMVLNRCIYNLRYLSKDSTRRLWRCVEYVKKKCPAYVATKNGRVVERACAHNHPFHDKRIMAKINNNVIFTSIVDAQKMGDVKKRGNSSEVTVTAVSDS